MPEARVLAVLTTGRQDWGLLRSTVLALMAHSTIEPRVWVGGMHLRERFGGTVRHLVADGVTIRRQLPFLAEPPQPSADAGRALAMTADALAAERPSALMLAGDRSETLAAAVAATLERIPIVHLHGGEETEGAIDNACRHALTKLSHLHLVSHADHARRVLQLGEDPRGVVVVGAPGADNLDRADLPRPEAVLAGLGIHRAGPLILVTVHPSTLGEPPLATVSAVSSAMAAVPGTYVVTAPNADEGGAAIRAFWEQWVVGRSGVALANALGEARYWALLQSADALLGNSSSGLVEAPAAGVPVVNVGERQRGRRREGAVFDVPADPASVTDALRRALATGRLDRLARTPAAPRIVAALEAWDWPIRPVKRFRDV